VSDPSDQELLSEYRNGRVEALETLIERYSRPVYGFLRQAVGNAAEADDVFQEIWLRAIANVHRYRHKNFLAWLLKIGHNRLRDRYRAAKRLVSLDAPAGEGDCPAARISDAAPLPSRAVADAELGLRIREAVQRLPEEQREVFLLRVEADVAFRDIARIQGVSINTALARMRYAVGKLQGMLHEDYENLDREPARESAVAGRAGGGTP
jgi:RNA polymerase sigma-70 factor (ECF subfamily)